MTIKGKLTDQQAIAFKLHMACAKYKFDTKANPIKMLATECEVTDATIRNWLDAKNPIPAHSYEKMQNFLKDYL